MPKISVVAIFLVGRPDGCKAVGIQATPTQDETGEEALNRIYQRFAQPHQFQRLSFCHGASSTWAIYGVPTHLGHLFHEELWQHPTVVFAKVGVSPPERIKRLVAKAF